MRAHVCRATVEVNWFVDAVANPTARTLLDTLALSASLEDLSLVCGPVRPAAVAAFTLLVRNCALKRLALRDAAPARVLAAVALCPQLQHFSLYILPFANFRVSAGQLESLAAAVKSANALKSFELSGARISNDKGDLGATLSQSGALASVNLNYTRRLALRPLPQVRILKATFCMCSLPRRTAGAHFSKLRWQGAAAVWRGGGAGCGAAYAVSPHRD